MTFDQAAKQEVKPVLFDPDCGEPIAWGWPISRYGNTKQPKGVEIYRLYNMDSDQYFAITRRLTHKEAIEKYGPVSNRERGPRGGFISNTYGKTTFLSKLTGEYL